MREEPTLSGTRKKGRATCRLLFDRTTGHLAAFAAERTQPIAVCQTDVRERYGITFTEDKRVETLSAPGLTLKLGYDKDDNCLDVTGVPPKSAPRIAIPKNPTGTDPGARGG